MADPLSTSVAPGVLAGTGYVTQDAVRRLLGPTLDYYGDELKLSIQRRRNAARIVQNAAEKSGDQLNEPGVVPPRILRDVINEGSWNEDQVSVEYFGGVLASSRTPTPRDDRGATLTSLISRLSTYQMRSHYILYAGLREAYKGAQENLSSQKGRRRLETVIHLIRFVRLMEFSEKEMQELPNIVNHVMFGLERESLIGNFEYFQLYETHTSPGFQFQGLDFRPTVLGVELFLSAHGLGNKHVNAIFDPKIPLKPLDGLSVSSDDAFRLGETVKKLTKRDQ